MKACLNTSSWIDKGAEEGPIFKIGEKDIYYRERKRARGSLRAKHITSHRLLKPFTSCPSTGVRGSSSSSTLTWKATCSSSCMSRSGGLAQRKRRSVIHADAQRRDSTAWSAGLQDVLAGEMPFEAVNGNKELDAELDKQDTSVGWDGFKLRPLSTALVVKPVRRGAYGRCWSACSSARARSKAQAAYLGPRRKGDDASGTGECPVRRARARLGARRGDGEPEPNDAALADMFGMSYLGLGSLVPFLALVLQKRGVDGLMLTAALGALPLSRLVFGPLWSVLAAAFRRHTNGAHRRCSGGSRRPRPLAGASRLVGGCGHAGLGHRIGACRSVDGLTLKSLGDRAQYGRVRRWGSVGLWSV